MDLSCEFTDLSILNRFRNFEQLIQICNRTAGCALVVDIFCPKTGGYVKTMPIEVKKESDYSIVSDSSNERRVKVLYCWQREHFSISPILYPIFNATFSIYSESGQYLSLQHIVGAMH